ncbi:hypothetical protein QUF80_08855 [Desulfococcaceae bacterium HSG8]|nr:hypothetical protein [Desulfococcaceae bacterium HSG8]
MQFAVPPSGGITPSEGGTINFDLVCFLLEITLLVFPVKIFQVFIVTLKSFKSEAKNDRCRFTPAFRELQIPGSEGNVPSVARFGLINPYPRGFINPL